MSALPTSYADVGQNTKNTSGENDNPLGYTVNMRDSPPNSTQPEGLRVRTNDAMAGHAVASTSSPQLPRPSNTRRIAERLSSINFFASDSPTGTHVPLQGPVTQASIEDYLVMGEAKRKKKRKRGPRRRQSTHGDFLMAHNRGIESLDGPVRDRNMLIRAISDGNVEQVTNILSQPLEPVDRSLPLQQASLVGNEEIVKLLLESGKFDVNKRDSRERTALYTATSRGHRAIAELLLLHKAKPLSKEEARIAELELKRWQDIESQMTIAEEPPLARIPTIPGASITSEPEPSSATAASLPQQIPASRVSEDGDGEHLAKLELFSCENNEEMKQYVNEIRKVLQQDGKWVRGPRKSFPELSIEQRAALERHRHRRFPGLGFQIPIVEFDFPGDRHRVLKPIPTIDDLLYGQLGGQGSGSDNDSIGFGNDSTGKDAVRWYHLPANHLGWAEDLIRKIYASRDANEQRKRDVILNREPFSTSDDDHVDPTLLSPRPEARSLRPVFRTMTLEREGLNRISSCISLHMPFAHWEMEESRAEMHHVMKVVAQARKYDISKAIGERNRIPSIQDIQARGDWTKDEKLLCAYLYNNPPVHPRRTLDQFYYHMLEDTEHRDQDQVINRFYHRDWNKVHNVPEYDEGMLDASSSDNRPTKHSVNYNFSLDSPEQKIDRQESHATSKLSAQSPHSSVQSSRPDTLGKGQVKKAATADKNPNVDEIRHVLMIDQLWLWILDDSTIITSFPQNWMHEDGKLDDQDHLGVLGSIHQYLSLVNRPPLDTVYDLAQLIVFKCLSTFCSKPTPYGAMQILDVYEMAIASVMDKETKIFNDFAAKSKIKQPHDQPSAERDIAEELYRIDEEIEQLKEIKDIQDELHILSVLLHNQILVLHDAAQATEKLQKPEGNLSDVSLLMRSSSRVKTSLERNGELAPYSSKNDFGKLCSMLKEQEARRKSLQEQAERANKALDHLLDLKQKQANVSEARSARWTTESAKQQGNIILVFTLVTIIFAPLSLMVTIFQLPIVTFPQEMHIGYPLKYMFAVSIAVIVPLFALVVYSARKDMWNAVASASLKIMKWKGWRQQWWEARKERKRNKDNDADHSGETGNEGEEKIMVEVERGGS